MFVQPSQGYIQQIEEEIERLQQLLEQVRPTTHSFRINRDAQGGSSATQFGRVLAELNIEILCANSSQGTRQAGQPDVAGPAGKRVAA